MIYINARFLTQNITGVQRYAIEISKTLRKIYPDLTFIAPKNIVHLELAKEFNIDLYGKFKGHLWEQIDLPEYLKEHDNPLLVNLANSAPLLYKNQVITVHDLSFLREPKWFSKKFYYYYKFLIPKIANNSLKIITGSMFSKNEIAKLLKIPEKKIDVVYHGVSEKFNTIETTNNQHGNYFLAVSSLDPRKNLKNLILAFNKLNLKNTKLIIVGSESKIFADTTGIKKLMQSNNNIIPTGHINDGELIGLYKNAISFIYPSFYEGFGLPPLEAMACGCPAVVSNAASLPEVCMDAAYYIDPCDIESIAKGIYEVATNETLRQSLIYKGIERAKIFKWDKSAQKLIEILKK